MKPKIELVRNSDEILDSFVKIRSLKKGLMTNFYPDFQKIQWWIEEKQLYKVEFIHSIFYVRKQVDFCYLLYISGDSEELSLDISVFISDLKCPVVVEIISQKEDDDILYLFKSKKFEPYATLVRLNMKTPEYLNDDYCENIRKAESKDLRYLDEKLHAEFDKYSEQLPLKKELENLIQKGFVLLYEKDHEIAGFMILEIFGVTQLLRYWFVDSKYRDLKVGSALFNAAMYCGKDTKRQRLWCRTENENALKRHEHYGYKRENMFDHILTIGL